MLKDGLVLIWELDMNLGPTLLIMYTNMGSFQIHALPLPYLS